MSDTPATEDRQDASAASESPGEMLRRARQAKGLHIAALASAIKVTPQKLEALENDRYDELPGWAFARALAQTVCRALKIDPAPVLARMPNGGHQGLDRMSRNLNQPFRDKPGRSVPRDLGALKSPAGIGVGVLIVAALVVYLLPEGTLPTFGASTSQGAGTSDASPSNAPVDVVTSVVELPAQSASSVSGEPSLTASTMIETVHSAPAADAASATLAPAPAGALQVRTTGESWVEVIDSRGATVLSRLMLAGEAAGLDATPPLRVKIGNTAVTVLTYRGQPVDLSKARNNVLQLDIK